MTALAFADGLATLAAVAVTVCRVARLAGGVYKPDEEMEPACGDSVQVTAVLLVPVTVADNCWAGAPAATLMLAGATATVTAPPAITTVAVAVFDVSATLLAVTVTVSGEAALAGAVYRPEAEMDPICGERDHVAALLAGPVTVAANCCFAPARMDALAGETEMLVATGIVQVPTADKLVEGEPA